METPKLGQLVEGDSARRDAIHVAVAPVEAGEELSPGERVMLVNGRAYAAPPGREIGIVDPFLQELVPEGAKFWLCLLPGSITSLRHQWSHPAFAAKIPGVPE